MPVEVDLDLDPACATVQTAALDVPSEMVERHFRDAASGMVLSGGADICWSPAARHGWGHVAVLAST